MDKKEIIFEVDDRGNVRSEIKGTKGKTCADLAAELRKGIGTHLSEFKTREYYEKSVWLDLLSKVKNPDSLII